MFEVSLTHSVQTNHSLSVFPSDFTHKTRVLQCENVAIFNEVSKPYYAMDMLMSFRKAPAGCIPISIFCRNINEHLKSLTKGFLVLEAFWFPSAFFLFSECNWTITGISWIWVNGLRRDQKKDGIRRNAPDNQLLFIKICICICKQWVENRSWNVGL